MQDFTHPRQGTLTNPSFAERLVAWQTQHGRHDLPWQVTDPYRIWLSEIMLQQTQVNTVLAYYKRFVAQFPDIVTLAEASLDEVLTLWSGLGYYSRARTLHRTAQIIVTDFQGRFPTQRRVLETLPGIGRTTAAAIAVFAAQRKEAILDGNVKRVLARVAGITSPLSHRQTQEQLWQLAEQLLPFSRQDIIAYTQGLMDLGTIICRRTHPVCPHCPMQTLCFAAIHRQTENIPAKSPKRILPVRSTVMLLVYSQQYIYLEKRPPQGIWQGLWTLPAFDTLSMAEDFIRQFTANKLPPAWPTLTHTFTHFRLIITPQVIPFHDPIGHIKPLPGQWIARQNTEAIAMPAPIRRLIARLPTTLEKIIC